MSDNQKTIDSFTIDYQLYKKLEVTSSKGKITILCTKANIRGGSVSTRVVNISLKDFNKAREERFQKKEK